MGWKDVFSYTKALAANQGVGATVRADDKLPLGARIGSLVQMQVSPAHPRTIGRFADCHAG